MEIVGYLCAMLVGISLGLLGSGGSILTVPIMVYLMHIPPLHAISNSLFVVGVTSSIGGISYIRKKLIRWNTAVLFAIPSILSVFLTRKYLLPLLHDPVLTYPFILSRNVFTMILFSILMIIAGYKMIVSKRREEVAEQNNNTIRIPAMISIGLVCGLLTGFLGVGGGFIIIPALVLFAGVPIRMSVGTSLLIIAFNSFTGFGEDILDHPEILDYSFLIRFCLMSVLGIYFGYKIAMKIKAEVLKKIFGWFILLIGICLLLKEGINF